MAMAAVAYAKQKLRQRFMFATASAGPGSTNMLTPAAIAHVNRLPLLLLCGELLRHTPAGSGAAAGRAFRRSNAERERRFSVGQPILGPHHASSADPALAAQCNRDFA